MKSNDSTYWFAFNKVKIPLKRKNGILDLITKECKIIQDVFQMGHTEMEHLLGLSAEEIGCILKVKQNLNNISFLVEELESQGYFILSRFNENYPIKLREKLKLNAPLVLFCKGNLNLLKLDSVSIVGSRKANNTSQKFTKNIANTAACTKRTVVSGGAPGIDSLASQSALLAGGSTIIVLAEGVKKYKGYREYYKSMIKGRVLIISSFDPDDIWMTYRAQERNPIIYALGDKSFVAESGESGGTMIGALHALKQHWEVFIRFPELSEDNANLKLIMKGCLPVDITGRQIKVDLPESELEIEIQIIKKLEKLLLGNQLTIKEILFQMNIEWKGTRLQGLIQRNKQFTSTNSKPKKYTFSLDSNNHSQLTFFD